MKINLLTIVFAVISLGIGYYLNQVANKKNNEILIAELKAQIVAMNQTKTRVTPQERVAIEQQQNQLQAQIDILQKIS